MLPQMTDTQALSFSELRYLRIGYSLLNPQVRNNKVRGGITPIQALWYLISMVWIDFGEHQIFKSSYFNINLPNLHKFGFLEEICVNPIYINFNSFYHENALNATKFCQDVQVSVWQLYGSMFSNAAWVLKCVYPQMTPLCMVCQNSFRILTATDNKIWMCRSACVVSCRLKTQI